MKTAGETLQHKGIKPTPNRIIVLKALLDASYPMSLNELDQTIGTMDRSSIFRVLTLFHQSDVVHALEDGSGSLKYEACHSEDHCSIDDMHPHFYCERCHRTYCLEDSAIPRLQLPEGYTPHSINYMVKGICADCNKHAYEPA